MAEYIKRDKAINAVFEAFADGRSVYIALETVPAADVAPVVRGRWDDKTVAFFFKCSECGCCVGHRHDVFLDRGKLNYCPNCGAKMEGE